MNKKTFSLEIDGKKVELAVLKPSHKVSTQAQLVYNKAYRQAVEGGSFLQQQIRDVVKQRNLWDDDKQKRYEQLVAALLDAEKRLAQGGFKLSEARELAIQMRRDRAEFRQLSSQRNELDANTADSHAEQARFNYLVAASTVYGDSGKPYFSDVEDYLSRENDPVALPAAQALGKLMYSLDENYEAKLPENSLLLKYQLCRPGDLHLIRKDGRLIDAENHLVDEKGRLVNEQGDLVDRDGNLLTETGDYKVEFKEFENDLDISPAQEGLLVSANVSGGDADAATSV